MRAVHLGAIQKANAVAATTPITKGPANLPILFAAEPRNAPLAPFATVARWLDFFACLIGNRDSILWLHADRENVAKGTYSGLNGTKNGEFANRNHNRIAHKISQGRLVSRSTKGEESNLR